MKHRSLLTTCAAGALAMAATGALAQAAPPRPAQQAQSATTLGEIVVTAERREANLQEVPEAVTAFTSKERSVKGIETVQDMTDFTPGFTYSSQLDRPAMRGLGRNTNIYLADSSVGVYYDDFFSNSTFLVGRDDMLIDQVEVLLGPQGTLYGRNAIGGLINTLSKHPTDTLQGEMRVIAGNYGYTKVEGTLSGPITDHLSFRISAYDDNQNRGWLNNVVPGMPSEGGVRHDPYVDLQLEYKTDKDDLWLDSYAVGFNNDRGGPGSLLGTPTGGPYDGALTTQGNLTFNPNFPYGGGAVPGSVVGQIGTNNPALGNIRDFAHAITTDINVDKAYAVVLHYTHHFDGFDMKYIGGYSQYHYQLTTSYFYNSNSPITQYQVPINPVTAANPPNFGATSTNFCASADAVFGPVCGPLTVFPQNAFSFTTQTDWYSHELLFQSTGNGPLQWVAGVYYFNEWDNNPETFQVPGQAQLADPITLAGLVGGAWNPFIPGSAAAIPNPSRDDLLLDYQDRIQSLGEYAQLDWKITPTIKLTGGIRYTQDWKHAQEETRYIDFSDGVLNPYSFGSFLPAVDISPLEMSFLPSKGVCSLPILNLSGPFAGDYSRCLSDKSSAVTGTAGIEWTPDRDTLVYARYNRGYKAVAFNAGFVGAQPEAQPEHVDDFEVGFKKTFGHTFVLDADAFYYNYSNDQVPIGVPVGSVTLTEFINVPKAVSDGIELQAVWTPIRDLELSLTYGLDHTEITSKCTLVGGVATGACYVDSDDTLAVQPGARPVGPLGVQSVNGDELPQAPENKIAANGVYTFHLDRGDLALSATFIWKDKSYGEIFTRPYYEAPSWDQVNLRATWSGDHDRYEVVLYVNNLFNTLGYDAAGGSGFLATQPVGGGPSTPLTSYDLTPPRQYGVEVHYKF
ncbi:MAG TPA: TonB-dependent receptor [Caulobacteraceae bacterium]|jgi:iron complex outermembrane receptor protein